MGHDMSGELHSGAFAQNGTSHRKPFAESVGVTPFPSWLREKYLLSICCVKNLKVLILSWIKSSYLLRRLWTETVSWTFLFLVTSAVLKRTGHVYCEKSLSCDLSGVFFMVGLGQWV